MAQGRKFVFNFQKKANQKKAVPAKKGRSRVKSSFAKRVLSVIKSQEETKYVAENITLAPLIVPSSQITPANLARMLPHQTQGAGDHQRIGDSIKPIKACATWVVYINTTNLYDVVLNLVVLHVKGATTDVAVGALPGGDLLKVGNGTNTDPNAAFTPVQMLTQVNHYPINTDQYTLKKWYRKRFMKGANDINGPVGAPTNNSPPTGGRVLSTIKYTWKPPALKYSDSAQVLPRNHYPVYCIWATSSDGTPLGASLNFTCRSEIYYKDS